jgi:hypothetical protein
MPVLFGTSRQPKLPMGCIFNAYFFYATRTFVHIPSYSPIDYLKRQNIVIVLRSRTTLFVDPVLKNGMTSSQKKGSKPTPLTTAVNVPASSNLSTMNMLKREKRATAIIKTSI